MEEDCSICKKGRPYHDEKFLSRILGAILKQDGLCPIDRKEYSTAEWWCIGYIRKRREEHQFKQMQDGIKVPDGK